VGPHGAAQSATELNRPWR